MEGSASAPVFGDTESTASTTGYFDGEGCVGLSASGERLPAVLEVLVDTSGSMNDEAPGMNESKWTVTRSALLAAIDGMPKDIALGVTFYPNVPQNAEPCFDRQSAVAIDLLGPPGSAHRRAIEQAFASKLPEGGTPTHDAYQYAVSELLASRASGRRFLVLITDGVPTFSLGCVGGMGGGFFGGFMQQPVDAAPLVEEARTALGSDVRTFVIGSPGSDDARESLSRMAESGGTGKPACSHAGPDYCHFDMTSEGDLAAGLDASLSIIASAASTCEYAVPEAPDGSVLDSGKVNLVVTPPGGGQELVAQSGDASCQEGWQYAENGSLIRLCPNTCERIRSEQGQVSIQFGCLTVLR
jgi:hypothetical protein